MLRVKNGDESAFQKIVAAFQARVFGYLRKTLQDWSEAEDHTQEVFLRLYRYRDRYIPRAKFNTWVFHIAQNVARNALRNRGRCPLDFVSFQSWEQEHIVDTTDRASRDAPSRPLEREELADIVRSAVDDLNERHRKAVHLHQFEGRTYSEVGELLEMSPEAAKSLLYRARNQLRERLTPVLRA